MKQSSFEKTISVTGVNGTFEGKIVVTMNYTTESKTVHNRVLHDEQTIRVSYHKIEGFVNQQKWETVDKLESESSIKKELLVFQKKLDNHLEHLATKKQEKKFVDWMKDNGY